MAIELERTEARPPVPAAAARAPRLNLGAGRPTVQDRMLFTERLALLVETGMPLHVALKTLRDQTPAGAPMRKVLDDVLDQVTQGVSFGHALRRHPEVFSAPYVNVVLASEGSGYLHEVLRELVADDEKTGRLRSTLIQALAYPAFLIVFSLAVVVFVLLVVFPKFEDLFAAIRGDLPWTTRSLMWLSDLLRHHGLAILAALAAAGAGAVRYLTRPATLAAIDRLSIRMPVIRDILVEIHIVRITRIMGLSIGRGVGIVDTLAACRELVRNQVFRELMVRLQTSVNEGRGLAVALRDADWLPPLVSQMAATGEESGQLAHVMTRIADYYERELNRRVASFARLIEPVMLMFTGTLVGIIVSALILPIFKLSRAVH